MKNYMSKDYNQFNGYIHFIIKIFEMNNFK